MVGWISKKSEDFGAGLYQLLCRLKTRSGHPLLIVMYHQLAADTAQQADWTQWGIPTQSQFAAHLRFLRRHFRIMTVEDAMAAARAQGGWQEPTAAITFDDGYRSMYTIAWSVLREYGLPATVYLPSGYLNGGVEPWWLVVLECIKHWDITALPLREIESVLQLKFGAEIHRYADETTLRHKLHCSIRDYLETQPDEVVGRTTGLLRELTIPNTAAFDHQHWFLTWDQVREMATSGIRFGAHTISHANLAKMTAVEAEHEIVQSKEDIERQIAEPVMGFAYPYGGKREAYKRLTGMLAARGFTYAVTTVSGCNHPTTDPYLLYRIGMRCSTRQALLGHDAYMAILSGFQPNAIA